jgi:hypothetical protein
MATDDMLICYGGAEFGDGNFADVVAVDLDGLAEAIALRELWRARRQRKREKQEAALCQLVPPLRIDNFNRQGLRYVPSVLCERRRIGDVCAKILRQPH